MLIDERMEKIRNQSEFANLEEELNRLKGELDDQKRKKEKSPSKIKGSSPSLEIDETINFRRMSIWYKKLWTKGYWKWAEGSTRNINIYN